MLAVWFMRASYTRLPRVGHLPFICDLASAPTSPVTAILQHLAAQLKGESADLRLIWQYQGNASMREWLVTNKGSARVLRRTLMHTCALTKRRHAFYSDRGDIACLSCIVDHRQDPDRQWEVASAFCKLKDCCAKPGAARDFKKSFAPERLQPIRLFEPEMRKKLYTIALGLSGLSLASLERKHGRNRHFAHGKSGVTYEQFAAAYCNADLEEIAHGKHVAQLCVVRALYHRQINGVFVNGVPGWGGKFTVVGLLAVLFAICLGRVVHVSNVAQHSYDA
jgi:hypothetical protein